MTEPQAPDIGSVLRQARIRRGQSLEVVAQQTRIPRKMLDALEANRFEDFPATVYLRGFLKSYCDHLDVDFDPLWAQIDPHRPKPAPEPAPGAKASGPDHAEEEAHGGDGGPSASQLLPAVLLGGLAVAAIFMWLGSRKPEPPPVVRAPAQPPSAIAPINVPKEMTLRIISRTDAWMQVQTDGVMRFQGRAPAGFAQEWKAMDAFLLRTKDPAALTVTVDGSPVALADSLKTSSGDYKLTR